MKPAKNSGQTHAFASLMSSRQSSERKTLKARCVLRVASPSRRRTRSCGSAKLASSRQDQCDEKKKKKSDEEQHLARLVE